MPAVEPLIQFLATCFAVGSGSDVVVTVDPDREDALVAGIERAGAALGATVAVVEVPAGGAPHRSLPSSAISWLATHTHWIDLTRMGNYYADVMKAYVREGGRYLVANGMSEANMRQLLASRPLDAVLRAQQAIAAALGRGREMRVTSAAGTDLRVPLSRRRLSLDLVRESLMPARTGQVCFLPGQALIAADFPRVDGVIVTESLIWPPESLRPLGSPVRLALRDGQVASIDGGADAETLRRWFDAHAEDASVLGLSHVVFGVVPEVSARDACLITHERSQGALTFGFGNPWSGRSVTHTDVVVRGASIALDGVTLQRDGVVDAGASPWTRAMALVS